MGMINLGSSLRYGMNGKRRKNHAANPVRKKKPEMGSTLRSSQYDRDRHKEYEDHKKKYPSMMEEMMKNGTFYKNGNDAGKKVDNDYKKEVSKNYTVAPAYNKGAYQVIPKSQVKHIGK